MNFPGNSNTMSQNLKGVQAKKVQVGRDLNTHFYVNSPATASVPATSFRNVNAPIKYFQGRERLMLGIHEQLTECSLKNDLLDRVIALVGFGGTGKTELARKFVEVYDKAYPNVASINAESEDSIKKSFTDLAEVLRLPVNDVGNGKTVADRIYKHVGEHVESSVFIFDNANRLHTDDSGFGIFEYLPRQKYRNQPLFLITTRTAEWEADNVATLNIEELTKEESVRFLQARFELSQTDSTNKGDRKRKNLDSLIDQLYDCIQGYPLALQLAVANVNYMPKRDRPELLHSRLKKFITRVKELQDSLMTERVKMGGTDYEGTFQIIWQITMNQIDTDDNCLVGQHLLRILAYTDPDGAPCEDIREVFEARFTDERNMIEGEEFEEAMHLLNKLVLVHTYEDYKAQLTTRMHRMVQNFARRDDVEAKGLHYIIRGENAKLAQHYFASQPELAIPPAVLRSDQLITAWLRCFVELSIPIADNENGPELLFDSTHVQQLKERNCPCDGEIRATVELIKNLQSAEWDYHNSSTLTSGIIAYAKTIKAESPLSDSLLELAFQLLRKRAIVYMKESAFLVLKKWLLNPDTAFPPDFFQEGAQLQLLVFDVITISKKRKWDADELRRLLYKDYDSMLRQWVSERETFSRVTVDLEIEVLIKVILGKPLEGRFLMLLVVRNKVLKDKRSTESLLAMKNIYRKLRRYLQALQAKLASEWEMISAAGTVISGNRNPSSVSHTTGQKVALDLMPEEFNDDVRKTAAHVYTGYIICYSMALCDYDLNGGSFYQMLEKWLPSSEYLLTISVLTEFPRKYKYSMNRWLSAVEWNVDEDTLVLKSVLHKIREEKEPEPILLVFHQVVVEVLQLLSVAYRNAGMSSCQASECSFSC